MPSAVLSQLMIDRLKIGLALQFAFRRGIFCWLLIIATKYLITLFAPPSHEIESYSHKLWRYCDIIMGAMESKTTSLTIVYSAVDSGADQRKHQSFAPLPFRRGIHRWPMISPHKGPLTRKMYPFDDVIMNQWQTSATREDRVHVSFHRSNL